MNPPAQDARHRQLARATATAIYEAFDSYHREFKRITAEAHRHFRTRAWLDHQAAARTRLDVYTNHINAITAGLRTMLADDVTMRAIWEDARRIYAALIARRDDQELAETFFNSVTRRIFTTIGVDERLEFVWFGATQLPSSEQIEIIDVYAILAEKLELASGDGYHWSSPAYEIITREISAKVLPVIKK